MEKIGINKRLLNRRLELDYSTREASMRLDISRLHLYLIERGYLKVSEKLKGKFIRKYKLEEGFFDDDFLGYPTPIENEVVPAKKDSSLNKTLKSWKGKILLLVLLGAGIAMVSVGSSLSKNANTHPESFYTQKINDLASFVRNTPYSKLTPASEARTSTLALKDFYSYNRGQYLKDVEEGKVKEDLTTYFLDNTHVISNSLCFFESDELLSFTFTNTISYIKAGELKFGFPYEDCIAKIECRETQSYSRVHIDLFAKDDLYLSLSLAHISADYNKEKDSFSYNIIEDLYSSQFSTPIEENSFDYLYYTSILTDEYHMSIQSNENFFNEKASLFNVTYDQFIVDLKSGINNQYSTDALANNLLISGIVVCLITIAFLIIAIFKSIPKVEKVIEENVIATDEGIDAIKVKERKPLKRNWKFKPFIPEFVIRVSALIIMLVASLGLFYIFTSLKSGDVISAIENIAFRLESASAVCISMLLLFFIKLDIKKNSKNSFVINYILFFIGVFYYLIMIIIQDIIISSPAYSSLATLLDALPGNIIWGMLAFNLICQFLFETPKWAENNNKKIAIYRLLSIIPIAYLTISSLYAIGSKAWGWSVPFQVSNLLSSKALIMVIFSIVYCFSVFIYQHLIVKKYGKENGLIYMNGNKYAFVKNIIVSLIFIFFAIADILIAKYIPNNPFNAGGYYPLLFIVPIILLYRPHLGKRNEKLDILFAICYVLSLTLGIILIFSNISGYIASL